MELIEAFFAWLSAGGPLASLVYVIGLILTPFYLALVP